MIKRGISIFHGRGLIISVIAVIACWPAVPAHCQTQDIVLLIEQTPVKGGEITPGLGVHHFESGSEVTLTANPKPGYQFVYWLGDVSDSTSTNTVVYLNKPKVIIAVFEKTEKGASAGGGGFSSGGGGGMFPTALDFSRPGGFGGGSGGGKAKPQKYVYFVKDTKPMPEVPEPATGLMLMLGGLFAIKRRGPKRLTKQCTSSA